jgi:hypothetical protein
MRLSSRKWILPLAVLLMGQSFLASRSLAQIPRGGGGPPRPSDLGESKLDLGEPGIAWYTTWESAASEAKRSGRPIMFVAAATQCHGISGVF